MSGTTQPTGTPTALKVVRAFGFYAVGERIENASQIALILAGPNADDVLIVAVSTGPVTPGQPGESRDLTGDEIVSANVGGLRVGFTLDELVAFLRAELGGIAPNPSPPSIQSGRLLDDNGRALADDFGARIIAA